MNRTAPFRCCSIALLIAAAFALPAAAQTVARKYVVTELGSLDGSVGNTIAQGINNAGQVVGYTRLGASFSDPSRAFRTAANQSIKSTDNLGTLGGASSFGYAINASGQVVGDADRTDGVRRAFRLDPGGSMVDLGTFAAEGSVSFNSSGARAINDQAVVVGFARVPNNICLSVSRAFRTAPGGTVASGAADLGTLVPPTISCPSVRSSIAWGVNSAGTVVGNSATTLLQGTPNHAFRFVGNGPMEDLGVIGSGPTSTAFAINDRGEAVGETQFDGNLFSGFQRAFLKAGSNPLLDLGDLGGGYASAAAINVPSAGGDSQVVGRSSTGTALHGFVWTNGSGMADLNTLIASGSGWEVTFARAINGKGQIVGDALKDGVAFVFHAVRLDPLEIAALTAIDLLSDPSLALTQGQIASLTDKLNNVNASILAGLNKQAVNQLNAFISAVQTYWKNGKISSATAATLTAAANAIVAVL